MTGATRQVLSLDDYLEGIARADRMVLGRAITLVESQRQADQQLAQTLLERVLPQTGRSHRIGVSGVPGVGKSTLIEVLGRHLTALGKRVAVLAVDPTSSVTGGSIMGDKTRMNALSRDPNAFIRPSPTAGSLGGVAVATREAMLLCEAAGFDVVLVETVGVGQSETLVADMVDTFLVLMLPGAGDELQGIKRGIVELADVVAINKADGPIEMAARKAQGELKNALRILHGHAEGWHPKVVLCSAREGRGLEALWKQLTAHQDFLLDEGRLAAKRQKQQVAWLWRILKARLLADLGRSPAVSAGVGEVEEAVRSGKMMPTSAADRLLQLYRSGASA